MLKKVWFWRLVIGIIIIASLIVNHSSNDLPPMADMAMSAGY